MKKAVTSIRKRNRTPITSIGRGTRLHRTMACGALLVAGALASAAPAAAEKLDLSTMTCEQFIHADEQTIMVTLAWLDAYYKTDDDPPVIDTDKFERNAEKLGAYCAKNPSIGLITATDELFE